MVKSVIQIKSEIIVNASVSEKNPMKHVYEKCNV